MKYITSIKKIICLLLAISFASVTVALTMSGPAGLETNQRFIRLMFSYASTNGKNTYGYAVFIPGVSSPVYIKPNHKPTQYPYAISAATNTGGSIQVYTYSLNANNTLGAQVGFCNVTLTESSGTSLASPISLSTTGGMCANIKLYNRGANVYDIALASTSN